MYRMRMIWVVCGFVAWTALAYASSETYPHKQEGLSFKQGVGNYYIEARPVLAYAVSRKRLPYEPTYPTLQGIREPVGFSGGLGVRTGYQFFSWMSWEAGLGALFVESTRQDRMREMGWYTVSTGPRMHWEVLPRLQVYGGVHLSYVYVDDAVSAGKAYGGLQAQAGVQYIMPIRHFSLGVEAVWIDVGKLERMAFGVSPSLRYQF